MARSRSFARVASLALLGLLAACGTGGGVVLTSLQIVQSSITVSGCGNATSVQLGLQVTFADGGTATYPSPTWPFAGAGTWSSDDTSLATVAPGLGLVTGVAQGLTTVRISLGGLTDSVPVAVTCGPAATPMPVPVSGPAMNQSLGFQGGHAARCIAIDPAGIIHITWFDPTTGLRYARSTNLGGSFQPSVLLEPVATSSSPQPIIGCGQDGQQNVYVVFNNDLGEIRCIRSPDAGATWILPGALTGLTSFTNLRSVAVRGTTVCILTAATADYVRSNDNGTTFAPVVPSLVSQSVYADVLMDPRDVNTVIAVTDDPAIHFRVSADDGISFAPQVDSGVAALFYSDYAIDQLGNIFGVGQNADFAVIDVDTQTPILLPTLLAGLGNPGRSIAADAFDWIHIVRDDAGSLKLQSSFDSGATLTSEVTLDTGISFPSCAASYGSPGVGIVYVKANGIFYVHN